MKRSAIATLVCGGSLIGCNAVLGLHETHQQDAFTGDVNDPGIDASPYFVGRLTVFHADTNPDGTPKIDVASPPAVAPVVKIGMMTDRALVDAPYADGDVSVPNDYGGRAWRLVTTYDTIRGPAVHEYQWATSAFHITAPTEWGHPTPAPVPGANAGYAITPTGVGHALALTELFTSGVWADVRKASTGASFTFTWPTLNGAASTGEPLVGRFGVPEKAKNDWQWLVERSYNGTERCLATIGAAFQREDLGVVPTATAPAWHAIPRDWPAVTYAGHEVPALRLGMVPPGTITQLSMHGYVPRDGVPGFVRQRHVGAPVDPGNPPFDVPNDRPVMVPLLECVTPRAQPYPVVDQPELATSMSVANYLQQTSNRTLMGSPVVSSLQAISNTQTVVLAAPIARAVFFDDQALSSVGPDFSVAVAIGTPRFIDLHWDRESSTPPITTPDEWEVTLYKVAANDLRPVRVYHVHDSAVKIDTAVFADAQGATSFVFKIASHVGVPGAKDGDFSRVTYPYAAATAWTYGFTTTP
ncbi:MAG: hypothetical protein NT062_02015 [Proteobacteria bacterium]|nr:hypothetical protein [Pseudomonadota bacterium]